MRDARKRSTQDVRLRFGVFIGTIQRHECRNDDLRCVFREPEALNTDKAPAYAAAIAELKAEGKCPKDTRHRQVKYLNNVIEADHGKLKLLIRPVRGFKTLKTAYATIKGFEVMRALRKGQAGMFALQGGIVGEARIVERAFDLGPCALTEAMALLQDRLANAET